MNDTRATPLPEARFSGRAAIYVFLLAWLARGLYLAVAARADIFGGLYLDSRLYAESARAIRAGHASGLGQAPYLLSPLYAAFLALFPSMSGPPATNAALDVRLVQACIGALTCALAAVAAGKLAGRRAGWTAGVLTSLYAPAIHFDGTVLVASLSALLLTAALTLLIGSETASRPSRRTFLAGLLLGAAACLRPTVLLVSAALALALLLKRPAGRARAASASALLLGTVLAIAPFSLQNRNSGESFLITAGGGFNFWVGNHASSDGTFQPPSGYDALWDPVGKQIAEQALARPLTYTDSSRVFLDLARTDITREPTDWLRKLAHKAWLFAHPMEIPQLGASFEWQRAMAWPLRFPLDARWVLLLALVAPLLPRPASGRRSLVFPSVLLLSYALGVILFFVTARYRVPVMPVAMVLAAVSIDRALTLWSPRSVRCWGSVAAFLLVGTLSFQTRPEIPASALGERHRGLTLYERGDFEEAEQVLRAALEVNDNPKTRVALALALRELQRDGEARRQLERVLSLHSGDPDATFHLGVLMWETERAEGAARALFERTLVARPTFADAHFNLGAVELATGHMAAAVRALEQAIALAPPGCEWLPEAQRGLQLALRELASD
ncbi:MAG: 4-amino-4-deoxy-L-arabinose transferase-like glycosyltransferase [Chlamydiales bacterium]